MPSVDSPRLIRFAPLALLAVAGLLLLWFWLFPGSGHPGPVATSYSGRAAWAGSESCRSCHEAQFAGWSRSNHALAERPPSAEDLAAFRPRGDGDSRSVEAADGTARILTEADKPQLVLRDARGEARSFEARRIIGNEPLWQAVIPGPRGHYQASHVAYDPAKDEWFDATGSQEWQPGEWGHWSGRGMNWNSMCATCHTTRFRKNYHSDTDSYDTDYVELGVGCESCHGPSQKHVDAMRAAGRGAPQEGEAGHAASGRFDPSRFRSVKDGQEPPPPPPLTPIESPTIDADRVIDTCGSCHARRAELTGEYPPGADFLDHFRPDLPDYSDIFWVDGQIREEDYEYASFLSSKMHTVGVRCVHCHDPHTSRLRYEGNEMCLQCHRETVPDPAAHAHHVPGTPGGQCIDCHMPTTTYMERDPRHDHGFSIPDPLLTKEYGLPNACDRCHSGEGEGTDWSLAVVERWYGEKMDRPTRRRARILARAKRRDITVLPELIAYLKEETSPYWQAVATGFLEPWTFDRPEAAEALRGSLESPHPLVRAKALRALEPRLGQPNALLGLPRSVLEQILPAALETLDDPLRSVRAEAAWTFRLFPAPGSPPPRPGAPQQPTQYLVDDPLPAAKDLGRYLEFATDQPAGRLQYGIHLFQRGQTREALPWIETATEWNPTAAAYHDNLAVVLSALGRRRESLQHMRKAHELAPESIEITFRLGLSLSDSERFDEAAPLYKKVLEQSPQLASAWGELATAQHELGQAEAALETLTRAEAVLPPIPDLFQLRAQILRELGQEDEAKRYEERAQEEMQRAIEELQR